MNVTQREWTKLGYEQFTYAEQQDVIDHAIKLGYKGEVHRVLGTYAGDKCVEECVRFLLDINTGLDMLRNCRK